ncbi:MAG: ABC transporter ATP-binding protein [Candidatus Latescibacteria bacterium]|nr:ABC transporter ATP-binding protein [Candidatus Latescibacterota bacterium]
MARCCRPWIVDQLAAGLGGGRAAFLQTLPWVGGFFATLFIHMLLDMVRAVLQTDVQDRVSVRLQRQVVDKVQKVELVHFEHPAFYDALKRANEDLSGRLLSLLNVALDTVGTLGGMAAVVGVLLTGHWALGPLTLIGSIPGVLVMMWISKKTHYVYRERTPQYRETSYFRELLTEREQAMEVRLFTLRDHLLDTWRDKAVALAIERRGLEAKRAWLGGLTSSIGGWGYIGCLTILVWLVAGAQLTIGQYGMLARAVQQFSWQPLNTLHEESLYLGDLYEFLDLTAPQASPGAADAGQDLKNLPLRFEQVSFHYPDGDLVLAGIDLEIRPGERIALVGENGAGKTTLVKLMMGLYQPTGGRILLGDKPLLAYPQERVLQLFAAVFQDFVRFQFPVRDNIAFGALGQEGSVERAAELAGAAPFIADGRPS